MRLAAAGPVIFGTYLEAGAGAGAGGVMIKKNWFVKEGLLKEGESFKYIFKDGETEKSFDNSSLGFYFTFIKAELSAGDKVKIKRNKLSETKVEWSIEKQ